MVSSSTKSMKLIPLLFACSILSACSIFAGSWPAALDATKQSPGISRTINGVLHMLPAPILGPIAARYTRYSGPIDWQGNPAIGDPYIDSLNFRALATCESVTPGGDPTAYAPNDSDGGGARYGAYQAASGTWHYAVDLNNDPGRDLYQDPRNAPLWYQTYREKRLMLKELIRGPGSAWRYPPETHHKTCGERLFTGTRPTAERIS